ncbi:hypothetical protein B0H17DRAFT_1097029, partial [Mycena rosella]
MVSLPSASSSCYIASVLWLASPPLSPVWAVPWPPVPPAKPAHQYTTLQHARAPSTRRSRPCAAPRTTAPHASSSCPRSSPSSTAPRTRCGRAACLSARTPFRVDIIEILKAFTSGKATPSRRGITLLRRVYVSLCLTSLSLRLYIKRSM